MINSSRSIGDLLRGIVGVVTPILPRASSMDQPSKSCTLGMYYIAKICMRARVCSPQVTQGDSLRYSSGQHVALPGGGAARWCRAKWSGRAGPGNEVQPLVQQLLLERQIIQAHRRMAIFLLHLKEVGDVA